jgi:hypothetical protein
MKNPKGWIIAALVAFSWAGLIAFSVYHDESAYAAGHPYSQLSDVLQSLALAVVLSCIGGVLAMIALLLRRPE